jgi:hypothetical protein
LRLNAGGFVEYLQNDVVFRTAAQKPSLPLLVRADFPGNGVATNIKSTCGPPTTPTEAPCEVQVSYKHYPGQTRNDLTGLVQDHLQFLKGDDLIATNPSCDQPNGDWQFPYCRDNKFPQTLAIGWERCQRACEARPKCVDFAVAHPERGITAECVLAGAHIGNDEYVKKNGWDWYTREETCLPPSP